jgi:pyruvate formate-lyase activating enzyme-like uncharacterized protein
MALDDILIRIRTMFDGKGSTEASKSLDSLDQSSRRAAPALDKTAAATKQGSSAFGSFAESVGRARESAGTLAERLGEGTGVSGAVRMLGAGIRSLAGGPITIAITAITSIVAAFVAWRQKIKEVQEASAKLAVETQKLREINLDQAVADYDKLADSMNKAAAAQDKINEAKQRFLDAQTATKLAKIDLDEAKALAAVNPENAEARKAVSLDFAQKRLAVQNEAAIAKAAEESVAAQKKVSDGAKAMFVAQQALDKEESNLAKDLAIRASIVKASNRLMVEIPAEKADVLKRSRSLSANFGPGAGDIQRESDRLTQERDNLQQFLAANPIEAVDANIKKRREALAQRRENSRLATAASMAASTDVATAQEKQTTVAVSSETATVKVQDDVQTFKDQKARADLAARRTAAEAQLGPLAAQASTASDYLATIPDRISSGTYSQADQASMLQALASAQEQTALLQSFISRIGQEMAKQNEILRTLPTR